MTRRRPHRRATPRVMQSFRAPRPTTNPYITQLDRALAAEPGMTHLRFDWRTAVLGRVDVLHLHWPEVLLGADSAVKRAGKRALMRLLLLRLALTPTRVVRTVHNVELPDVDARTRRLLVAIDRRTDHRITLNPVTEAGQDATLIPHGHYRDWFAGQPRVDLVPGRFGYFGLIRRYKGVEDLLAAFASARSLDPHVSLRVGGKPSSEELASAIADAAATTPGVTTDLHFLDDAELVEVATSSQLLVFPYRFMHNSGGALTALSLDRPVILPRNAVNERLAHEAGPGWVHLYDGELTAERLLEAIGAVAELTGSPRLEDREWASVGRRHREVYERLLRRPS